MFEKFVVAALIACLILFAISLLVARDSAAKVKWLEMRLDHYMEIKSAQRNRAQRKRIAEKYLRAGGGGK